jgi:hypothetical protein
LPYFSLSLLFFLQTDQVKGEDLLGISFWSPEISKSLPFVVCSLEARGKGKPEAQPCRTLFPLPLFRPAAALDPQWMIATLQNPSANPHLAATSCQYPTLLWPSPCPPWSPQQGQLATVHPLPCHLAARLTTTRRTNSPKQKSSRPTVHRTPTMPGRRHRTTPRTCASSSSPLHARLHGTKRPSRRHHCSAPWCTVTTPPRPKLTTTSLKTVD